MSAPYRPARGRRSRWSWLLVLLFVVMPILEIYVVIQVGQAVGVGWTILLIIAAAVLGSWLIKHEGARTWTAMRETLGAGRMPTKELADGALILIGGTLMVAPGFVTDAFGVLFVLPVTRPLFRKVLAGAIGSRMTVVSPAGPFGGAGSGPRPGRGDPAGGAGTSRDDVIPGEVVDPDDS